MRLRHSLKQMGAYYSFIPVSLMRLKLIGLNALFNFREFLVSQTASIKSYFGEITYKEQGLNLNDRSSVPPLNKLHIKGLLNGLSFSSIFDRWSLYFMTKCGNIIIILFLKQPYLVQCLECEERWAINFHPPSRQQTSNNLRRVFLKDEQLN